MIRRCREIYNPTGARTMDAFLRAVQMIGTQAKAAALIGVSQQIVSYTIRHRRRIPADWCPIVEKATQGKVTRHMLRPDLFKKGE